MRLYPEQLATNLHQGLSQSYLLFGSEPLLKYEAMQAILAKAKSQGFDEIHRFSFDSAFDWQRLFDCCQSLSLFSARQIIILSLEDSALKTSDSNNLKMLAGLLHSDILLIVQGDRLNQKQEASGWFAGFARQGAYVVCNNPDSKQMPKFIKMRCDSLGLKPSSDAIALLTLWHEGNLQALSQSLMKLQLLYPDGHLSLARIEEALSPSHHFTPFALIDALLAGQAERGLTILRQLQAEGVEITLLLRLIQKELVQLYKMREQFDSGVLIGKIFDEFRLWQQKRPLYSQALHRLAQADLIALIAKLSQLELEVKMHFSSQSWQLLTELCLRFCALDIAKSQY